MAMTNRSHVYIHSPLARIVYNKMMEDNYDEECSHAHWYKVNIDQLPEPIRSRFVQSHEDEQTQEFLRQSQEKSDWIFTQLLYSFLKYVLSWVMTNTSINGLLQRGSMFVFSEEQFLNLLNVDRQWRSGSLLDLGAGDGSVSQQMAPYFTERFATEVSSTMRWRLEERGFSLLDVEDWQLNHYDMISCLNLIDRCDHPMTLLKDIHAALKPDTGRLLLAVVLPFSQYIEASSNDHKPAEVLRLNGKSFEQQLTSLVKDILEPAGFILDRFTRLPYLCEGDLYHSYYVLNDAVLLLQPVHKRVADKF